jgi:hypothetical protein
MASPAHQGRRLQTDYVRLLSIRAGPIRYFSILGIEAFVFWQILNSSTLSSFLGKLPMCHPLFLLADQRQG